MEKKTCIYRNKLNEPMTNGKGQLYRYIECDEDIGQKETTKKLIRNRIENMYRKKE